jgi:hypothetical protein
MRLYFRAVRDGVAPKPEYRYSAGLADIEELAALLGVEPFEDRYPVAKACPTCGPESGPNGRGMGSATVAILGDVAKRRCFCGVEWLEVLERHRERNG